MSSHEQRLRLYMQYQKAGLCMSFCCRLSDIFFRLNTTFSSIIKTNMASLISKSRSKISEVLHQKMQQGLIFSFIKMAELVIRACLLLNWEANAPLKSMGLLKYSALLLTSHKHCKTKTMTFQASSDTTVHSTTSLLPKLSTKPQINHAQSAPHKRKTELRIYYSDHVYRQQVYLHLLWLCARTLCECRWSAVGPLWTPARCPFWAASQLVTSINGCFHLSFRLKWLHLPHCDRVCHLWIGASGPVCCCFRQTHPLCCS